MTQAHSGKRVSDHKCQRALRDVNRVYIDVDTKKKNQGYCGKSSTAKTEYTQSPLNAPIALQFIFWSHWKVNIPLVIRTTVDTS